MPGAGFTGDGSRTAPRSSRVAEANQAFSLARSSNTSAGQDHAPGMCGSAFLMARSNTCSGFGFGTRFWTRLHRDAVALDAQVTSQEKEIGALEVPHVVEAEREAV